MYYLKSCYGQYCHEYDHVQPFAKGGDTSIDNCQVLQTKLNRVKSSRDDVTFAELRNLCAKNVINEFEMDAIEKAVYSDVKKYEAQDQVRHMVERAALLVPKDPK